MSDTPAWDQQPRYNERQLYNLAKGAGFKGDAARTMTAVSMAESGGNPKAINWGDPEGSYGLTQINQGAHGAQARKALDPTDAMKEAYALYAKRGNFDDWSTYKTGAYRQYMPPAGWGESSQPTKPKWDTGAESKSSTPAWDLPNLHDRPEATAGHGGDAELRAWMKDRPQGAVDPEITARRNEQFANNPAIKGITSALATHLKSLMGIKSVVENPESASVDFLINTMHLPPSLARDVTQFFLEFEPMRGGLGKMGYKPEADL